MLIQKRTLDANDIVTMKISTGEEIIAKIKEIDDTTVTVLKPFTLILTAGHGGQGSVAFAPFMLGADDQASIVLDRKNIVLMVKANSSAAGQYIKATTGLETAINADNIIKF